jgi:predicted nucleotidyltransferase
MAETVAPTFDRTGLVRRLRELEPEFRKAGVTSLAIFGSRARGDNRPDSDVDVLIEVDLDRKFSLFDLVGLEHLIVDKVGLSASLLMRRSLDPQFEAAIKDDVIEVF